MTVKLANVRAGSSIAVVSVRVTVLPESVANAINPPNELLALIKEIAALSPSVLVKLASPVIETAPDCVIAPSASTVNPAEETVPNSIASVRLVTLEVPVP